MRNESNIKLDMGLFFNVFLTKFPKLKLLGLKISCSDHNPLLLTLEDTYNWGPRTFDAWFLNPKFKTFIRDEWQNLPPVALNDKLRILKGPLRSWSRDHFDLLDEKINKLETTIHDLDKLSDSRTLNNVEIAKLNAAQSLLQSSLIRKERIWRQKARTYGFKMKDHNTKLFMASTLFRRKKNEIVRLKVKGRAIQGISNLKVEIRNFFAQRFSQDSVPDFDFELENHPKITEEQSIFLETTHPGKKSRMQYGPVVSTKHRVMTATTSSS